MTSKETWQLERAVKLCREAPLDRRGNVSYEQDDVLRELSVLMDGVMTLCRIADKLLDDIDASKRQITIREETMLAVLYSAVTDLGFEALVIDSVSSGDPENNDPNVEYLNELKYSFAIPYGVPTQSLPLVLPEGVLALDVAANMLAERITQIRGRGIPMDQEPDPNDHEGIEAAVKELLEPHCWPVLPERTQISKSGTPKWRRYKLLRRLRLPTTGELSCLGLPTLITAALLFMFRDNTVDGWLFGISLAMGFLGLYSHIGTKREKEEKRREDFNNRRERMSVYGQVFRASESFEKRLRSAVRGGPRGRYLPSVAVETMAEAMVDDWMRMHPPPPE